MWISLTNYDFIISYIIISTKLMKSIYIYSSIVIYIMLGFLMSSSDVFESLLIPLRILPSDIRIKTFSSESVSLVQTIASSKLLCTSSLYTLLTEKWLNF